MCFKRDKSSQWTYYFAHNSRNFYLLERLRKKSPSPYTHMKITSLDYLWIPEMFIRVIKETGECTFHQKFTICLLYTIGPIGGKFLWSVSCHNTYSYTCASLLSIDVFETQGVSDFVGDHVCSHILIPVRRF